MLVYEVCSALGCPYSFDPVVCLSRFGRHQKDIRGLVPRSIVGSSSGANPGGTFLRYSWPIHSYPNLWTHQQTQHTMTIAYLRGRHQARHKKGVHLRSSAGHRPTDGRIFSASHNCLSGSDAFSFTPVVLIALTRW